MPAQLNRYSALIYFADTYTGMAALTVNVNKAWVDWHLIIYIIYTKLVKLSMLSYLLIPCQVGQAVGGQATEPEVPMNQTQVSHIRVN